MKSLTSNNHEGFSVSKINLKKRQRLFQCINLGIISSFYFTTYFVVGFREIFYDMVHVFIYNTCYTCIILVCDFIISCVFLSVIELNFTFSTPTIVLTCHKIDCQ